MAQKCWRTNNGKYINADNLYERLEKRYRQIVENYSEFDAQQYIMGFGEAINALKNEPAANVTEDEEGNWIRINDKEVCCSRCRLIRNITTQDGWNFCPGCGALMLED